MTTPPIRVNKLIDKPDDFDDIDRVVKIDDVKYSCHYSSFIIGFYASLKSNICTDVG